MAGREIKGDLLQSNPASNCPGCEWLFLNPNPNGVQMSCMNQVEIMKTRTPDADCSSRVEKGSQIKTDTK